MAARVRITDRAAAQIDKAQRWWLANRPLARTALRDDLDAALDLISAQPEIGTKYRGATLSDVRRLHLGRIGYFVYYRVGGDELVVLALWHSTRGRGPSV